VRNDAAMRILVTGAYGLIGAARMRLRSEAPVLPAMVLTRAILDDR
jgi:uncharacterized protein YbjT (DUF2867 family)